MSTSNDTKLIAYYLPQFHPIPENDAWWGKGFTEWTNVVRAKSYFEEHQQPRLPTELGFYDLRVGEVMQQQAELARAHGIHGFCFYYYWFANGKRLLEKPLAQMLETGTPDLPYCLCWANENWSRRWDGGEHEVLMPQDHSQENNRAFIQSMVPFFRDPRYIRVDGKPMLLIYRAELLPDPLATTTMWRDEMRAAGIGEIHLVCVQSFAPKNPLALGFDAAAEFPPHQTPGYPVPKASLGASEELESDPYDYRQVVMHKLAEPPKPWRQYRGVMVGWDNTPRRKGRGKIFVNGSPQWYGYWLEKMIASTERELPQGERFVFINAWNEWAEGAYLEPDQHHGRAYLEATRSALSRGIAAASAVVIQDPELDTLQRRYGAWLPSADTLRGVPPVQGVTIGYAVCALNGGAGAPLAATLASLDAMAGAAAPRLTITDAADMQAASQRALAHAKQHGWHYLVFLAPGDRVLPHASLALATRIAQDRAAFVYGDEIVYRERVDDGFPNFKPDFNLDLLRGFPYVGGPLAIACDTLAAFGGFAAGSDGLEEYELMLRALGADPATKIAHVPLLLALRCEQFRPGAERPAAEVYAVGQTAVQTHWQARGVDVDVVDGLLPGSYRSAPVIATVNDTLPLVSIIVPTRDELPLLERCITTLLEKTSYPNYELVIINHLSREPATRTFLDGLRQLGESGAARLRVIDYFKPFNFAAMMNFAAGQARGDILLLLNNDTAILHGDWLESMLRHAMRPEVGAVGARLLYPDGSIQHGGIALGLGGFANPLHVGSSPNAPGLNGRLQVEHNPSAVSAACLMVRKAVFDEVGGLDAATFGIHWNDVDFCLRLAQAGYLNVWTPYATLLHEHRGTRKAESPQEAGERERAGLKLWERHLTHLAHDPAYNPNLTLGDSSGVQEVDANMVWPLATHARPRIVGTAIDDFGVGQYRSRQPLAALQAASVADTKVLRYSLNPLFLERFEADVVMLQRPFTDAYINSLRMYQKFARCRRVIELDDLVTEVPRENAHYAAIPKNIGHLVRKACELADRVIVSTAPLAEAYRELHHDIRVVPNGLPPLWRTLANTPREAPIGQGAKRRKPRVGWAGGISHAGDLRVIAPVVEALASEIDFVFFGLCPRPLRKFVKEFHAALPFEQYPMHLATLALDVAIAPLDVNRFNECKSNLRLLEYGALGLPVIATDIAPYQGKGEGALPVTLVRNHPQTWLKAIRELAFDPAAAAQAGQALRAAVLAHWMLEHHLPRWADALLADTVVGSSTPARAVADRVSAKESSLEIVTG